MLKLIDRLTGAEQRAIEAGQHRYAELLLQGNEDQETERELAKLMENLGKGAADLQADYREVEKMKTALHAIEDGSGLSDARQAAAAKLRELAAQTKAIADLRAEEYRKLLAEQNQLENAHIEADRAVNVVKALKKARPDLFAAIAEAVLS
jgi:hypothetical protein